MAIGADHAERLAEIAKQKVEVEARLKDLKERWTKEFELVSKIRELHAQIEGKPVGPAAAAPGVAPARGDSAAAPAAGGAAAATATAREIAAPAPPDPAGLARRTRQGWKPSLPRCKGKPP